MTERTLGREQAIYRVTWIGFAVNLVLSAGKLAAGIWGHSAAMVADAIHSVSDFATDLVVLLFVRVSAKPRDDDHDYGHGKYETRGLLPTQPGVVALWAAVVSIVAKEALYRYTARVGRRVNSPSVVANAWHHRSDALSSVGTLVGIGCAYFLGGGWRLADPAAAIVVALLILRVAWQLMKMGMDELLEKSLPREQEEHILTLIAADPAVASPHNLRTRRIGQNIAPAHRRHRAAAARRLRGRDDRLDPRRTPQTAAGQRIEVRDRQIVRFGVRFSERPENRT